MRRMMLSLVVAVAVGAGCDAKELERLGLLKSTPMPSVTLTPTTKPTPPWPTYEPTPTLAPLLVRVDLIGDEASPSVVTVRRGGEVRFYNLTQTVHLLESVATGSYNFGELFRVYIRAADFTAVRFNMDSIPPEIKYECAEGSPIHMKGVIRVVE